MAQIRGPDPHPKKPELQLPAGACDAHCHIYGPANRFPYVQRAGYIPPDAPFEDMRKLHEFLGIDRAVIVHPNPHGTDYRVTLDGIARSEGRYRGVATAYPEGDITDDDLQRLHEGGMRGLRFTFLKRLQGIEDRGEFPVVQRLCERIARLGWHLVVYFDFEKNKLPDFADLLTDLPVPFVLDHMGSPRAADGLDQPAFQTVLALMRSPNAWAKVTGAERVSTAGPPFDDAVPFAQALIQAAPDRVLWGTDWPHPNVTWMPNDGDLVDHLARYAPDETTRRKILVDNPTRLYWPEMV